MMDRCRYGELEEVSFGESLTAVRLPELGADLDGALPSLHSFAAATESALSAALERCRQATGASSLDVLTIQASGTVVHASILLMNE